MHLNASASRCTEALMHPRLDAQVLDPSDPRSTLKNCQHPHFSPPYSDRRRASEVGRYFVPKKSKSREDLHPAKRVDFRGTKE